MRHDRTAAGSSGGGAGGGGAGQTVAERTSKRKQSTSTGRRHHSVRRGSQYHEVHIAMLPDLSGNCHYFRFIHFNKYGKKSRTPAAHNHFEHLPYPYREPDRRGTYMGGDP